MTVVYIICAIIAVIAAILLQSLIFTVDYGDDFTVYLRFLFIKRIMSKTRTAKSNPRSRKRLINQLI